MVQYYCFICGNNCTGKFIHKNEQTDEILGYYCFRCNPGSFIKSRENAKRYGAKLKAKRLEEKAKIQDPTAWKPKQIRKRHGTGPGSHKYKYKTDEEVLMEEEDKLLKIFEDEFSKFTLGDIQLY